MNKIAAGVLSVFLFAQSAYASFPPLSFPFKEPVTMKTATVFDFLKRQICVVKFGNGGQSKSDSLCIPIEDALETLQNDFENLKREHRSLASGHQAGPVSGGKIPDFGGIEKGWVMIIFSDAAGGNKKSCYFFLNRGKPVGSSSCLSLPEEGHSESVPFTPWAKPIWRP